MTELSHLTAGRAATAPAPHRAAAPADAVVGFLAEFTPSQDTIGVGIAVAPSIDAATPLPTLDVALIPPVAPDGTRSWLGPDAPAAADAAGSRMAQAPFVSLPIGSGVGLRGIASDSLGDLGATTVDLSGPHGELVHRTAPPTAVGAMLDAAPEAVAAPLPPGGAAASSRSLGGTDVTRGALFSRETKAARPLAHSGLHHAGIRDAGLVPAGPVPRLMTTPALAPSGEGAAPKSNEPMGHAPSQANAAGWPQTGDNMQKITGSMQTPPLPEVAKTPVPVPRLSQDAPSPLRADGSEPLVAGSAGMTLRTGSGHVAAPMPVAQQEHVPVGTVARGVAPADVALAPPAPMTERMPDIVAPALSGHGRAMDVVVASHGDPPSPSPPPIPTTVVGGPTTPLLTLPGTGSFKADLSRPDMAAGEMTVSMNAGQPPAWLDGSGDFPGVQPYGEPVAPIPAGASAPQIPDRGAAAPDPAPIARQIAQALAEPARDPGVPLDLTLDPPELGRLRLGFAEVNGTLTVTIVADRSDTADLIRRHIALLAEEFARAGLDAPSVSISHGGSGHRPQSAPLAPERPDPDHAPATQALAPSALVRRMAGVGLDIRL